MTAESDSLSENRSASEKHVASEGHFAPEEGRYAPEGHRAGKAKLLIIDDDPMTCQLIKIQLEMNDYTCVTLSDPGRVLEVIAAESPVLALVDFHLGTHGGLDLLQTIRSHREYRSLPVVIMSGMDYQRESEAAGADGFVLKPFSLEDLVTAVQEVLGRQGV